MRTSILLAIFTLISYPAFALDNGECGTPEAMTQKLKAEDQHSVASAERVVRRNNYNDLYGIIFTASSDRAVGYIPESDKPTGEHASKICVRNRLADLRFFDARKPGIPRAALLNAPDADGERKCAELEKAGKFGPNVCGSYNTMIGKGEPNGERIMMQGFNVEKENGIYRKAGTLTTVTGNVNGSLYDNTKDPVKNIIGGVFFTSLPDGATIINMTMVYAEYTPYGLSLLP